MDLPKMYVYNYNDTHRLGLISLGCDGLFNIIFLFCCKIIVFKVYNNKYKIYKIYLMLFVVVVYIRANCL